MKRKIIPSLLILLLWSCQKVPDTKDVFLKFYGDAYEDIGFSIAKADKGYFIASQITEIVRENPNYISGSLKKFCIIKTGDDGVLLNKQVLGDTLAGAATRIISLSDGRAVCTGYVVDPLQNQKDIIVGLLDASGNVLTRNIFKKAGNQYGIDILQTREGYLILGSTDVRRDPVTDYTGNVAGKKDILLLRIDNNLQEIASRSVGFIGDDEGVVLKNDIVNGYIVAGTTDRSDKEPSEQAGLNIFLLKINTDGSTTQPKIIGGLKDESASDIEVLDGGYLIAGTIGKEGTNQTGYVWKISENIYADPLAEHSIDVDPGLSAKTSFSIKAVSRYKTNSFLMAGQYGSGLSARMLIFAADADGNMIDGWRRIAGGTGSQIAYDVISDEDDILVVGKNSYENNSMISLLKFRF